MEVAIIIILGLAIIFGGLFLFDTAQKQSATKTAGNLPLNSSQTGILPNADNSLPVAQAPSVYQDDSASWYATPKEVSLKLFTGDNQPLYKIWEVGNLKDNGGKLYLAAIDNQDPSGIAVMRFVQASFNTPDLQIRLLSKYSSSSGEWYKWNSKVVASGADNWTSIRSLEFPGVVAGPKGSTLNKEEDFPAGNDMKNVFFSNIQADLASPQKIWTDPVYGDFFLGKNQGLYVKAADGTYKIYSMKISILDAKNIANVTWNDGTKNNEPYTYKTVGGCGATGFLALASDDKITENDVVQIGKTGNGEAVYGLKDPNADFLKKWYKENIDAFSSALFQDMNKDGFWSLNGKTDKFSKSTTYQQFLNAHPLFYWRDQFGRLVRFMASNYVMGSGGCGKPVIYLYPEQTENVSVKVTPTGGMSVSDPAYGQGWNVSADPQSNITNLADGKTYPYLFWEGRGDAVYQMPTRGFVASRAALGNLMDEKLAQLGLIPKEIADFKEFWLPKMLAENKPYYFVTFVSRQVIDKLAPLSINPQPDTIIRVLMDYKGLNSYENVPGFNIQTPERKGFTAVEWGGVLK